MDKTYNIPGVTLSRRGNLALATVIARKNKQAELTACVKDLFGLTLPTAPRAVSHQAISAIGIGPETWLLTCEVGAGDWVSHLTSSLAGLASVSDQSSGYIIFRLGGDKARALLSKGVFLDLHPAAFQPGSAATTTIAHIGVILWQGDAAPTYDLAVFRSYAADLEQWITLNAAEYEYSPH